MKKMIIVANTLTISHLLLVTERKYFSSSVCADSMFISDSSTFESIRMIVSSCATKRLARVPKERIYLLPFRRAGRTCRPVRRWWIRPAPSLSTCLANTGLAPRTFALESIIVSNLSFSTGPRQPVYKKQAQRQVFWLKI